MPNFYKKSWLNPAFYLIRTPMLFFCIFEKGKLAQLDGPKIAFFAFFRISWYCYWTFKNNILMRKSPRTNLCFMSISINLTIIPNV